ncbi:hypothetical protein ACOSQ2_028533 [Xanthoceras sorbifolium]
MRLARGAWVVRVHLPRFVFFIFFTILSLFSLFSLCFLTDLALIMMEVDEMFVFSAQQVLGREKDEVIRKEEEVLSTKRARWEEKKINNKAVKQDVKEDCPFGP